MNKIEKSKSTCKSRDFQLPSVTTGGTTMKTRYESLTRHTATSPNRHSVTRKWPPRIQLPDVDKRFYQRISPLTLKHKSDCQEADTINKAPTAHLVGLGRF
nr:hypothetical protein BgiMline_011118 [Biomphalaria glabrata]